MSESSFEWFVQMAGGIVLGPMPRDDMTELAESGGLLPHDLVREGENGNWRPASDVSGLLAELDDDSALLGESPEDADFELQPGLQLLDDPLNDDVLSQAEAAPEPVADSPPGDVQLPDHLDLVPESVPDKPPMRPPRMPSQSQASSTTASTQAARGSSSEPDPFSGEDLPDEPSFDLSLLADVHESADSEDDEEDSSPYQLKADHPPADDMAHLRPIDRKTTTAPHPQGRPSAGDSPAVKTANKVAGQVWSFMPSSLRRKAMFAVIGAVAIAVLKLAAPSLLPSDEPYIYESVASIHNEMLAFDAGEIDLSGWTEFSQSAGEELELNRPSLEENAVPGERGRSLLLYVTRDLQEMLKLPPGSERPHQQRVDGFFEQLEELYASDHE